MINLSNFLTVILIIDVIPIHRLLNNNFLIEGLFRNLILEVWLCANNEYLLSN